MTTWSLRSHCPGTLTVAACYGTGNSTGPIRGRRTAGAGGEGDCNHLVWQPIFGFPQIDGAESMGGIISKAESFVLGHSTRKGGRLESIAAVTGNKRRCPRIAPRPTTGSGEPLSLLIIRVLTHSCAADSECVLRDEKMRQGSCHAGHLVCFGVIRERPE